MCLCHNILNTKVLKFLINNLIFIYQTSRLNASRKICDGTRYTFKLQTTFFDNKKNNEIKTLFTILI